MEATLREPARELPVAGEFDICVIGGSCTGVFAAVSAARLGARVALVEAQGFFGGTATASLVNVWHSLYDTTGQQQIIGGLTAEVIARLLHRGAARLRPPTDRSVYCTLNPAELMLVLDELVLEAGVRPFLHTRFAAPLSAGPRLDAVAIEDKSGRRAIRAAYWVDATGDADLIARSGLPCFRPEALQPPTTCALLGGLSTLQAEHPELTLERAAFDPHYGPALPRGFLWSALVPGAADVTMVAGTRVFGADCSDADELTAAEIEGRRQVRALCDVLRTGGAGGEQTFLAMLPARIGIRETRHARCLHTLSEQEVLHGTRFADAIANGTYRVDIHHHDRPGLTFRYLDGTEAYVAPGEPKTEGRWATPDEATASYYQIPYRCLVPQGAANVLVAGRALDADQGAFGAVRVMVNCNQTGEAAGTAAYLALAGGIDVAAVDPQRLRETMARQEAIVL